MTETMIAQRPPGQARKPVLYEPAGTVRDRLKANPRQWFLIGGGPISKLSTYAQTGHRIRHGLLGAFSAAENPGGCFEVRVSTDRTVADRTADVELYARWLPGGIRPDEDA